MSDLITAFAATWPLWAFATAVTVGALHADRKSDRAWRPLPESLDEYETCAARSGAFTCGRAAGHDGEHLDPYRGTRYHAATWRDEVA